METYLGYPHPVTIHGQYPGPQPCRCPVHWRGSRASGPANVCLWPTLPWIGAGTILSPHLARESPARRASTFPYNPCKINCNGARHAGGRQNGSRRRPIMGRRSFQFQFQFQLASMAIHFINNPLGFTAPDAQSPGARPSIDSKHQSLRLPTVVLGPFGSDKQETCRHNHGGYLILI